MADDHSTQKTLWETGEPTRRCRECNKIAPLADFASYRRKGGYLARYPYCKQCVARRMARYRKTNRAQTNASARKSFLRAKYGMTEKQYAAMEEAQGGRCAICRQQEATVAPCGELRALAVDHNHTTGAVRALLCAGCNAMIGLAMENPAILRAGADYLERFSGEEAEEKGC